MYNSNTFPYSGFQVTYNDILGKDILSVYLLLKSHDPAARSTLFGCQSRLRTVERIGFLICLLTHLKEKWNTIRISEASWWPITESILFNLVRASNSPVIFRLEVANRYEASATAYSEFVLQRRPLHERGSTVDPEDDESGLPHAVLLAPHVSVAIRSTGYNPIAFRSPVNALGHTE